MPSKIALTPAQWREKLLAVLPPWILEDVEESVLSSHLAGAAAVLSACEADAYEHIDKTWIERCDEVTLLAHMAERIIPELGYSGQGLRRQIQRMWNRLDIEEIRIAVNDLLTDDTCDIEYGVSGIGHTVVALDYRDDGPYSTFFENEEGEQIEIGALVNQPLLFNVIINPLETVSFSFADRGAYADSGDYAGYSSEEATVDLAKTIAGSLDFYKVAGVRYRISKRT